MNTPGRLSSPPAPEPVEVPMDSLPEDVLTRIIEDFVTRGGTDDGQVDVALPERVAMVRRALARREARLLWDPESEQVMVVPRR